MTNSEIEITKTELTLVAKELGTKKEDIEKYLNKLDVELDNINKSWKGSDAIKYTKKMRDDYSVLLNGLIESLSSYIEYLGKVYEEYETLDNKYVGRTIEV
ncbi:MAG: WXG100 family type VII secretion target [Bacilli bacterium]|nr:WXG100 family type VII secretion target [Bacilli bacterium]